MPLFSETDPDPQGNGLTLPMVAPEVRKPAPTSFQTAAAALRQGNQFGSFATRVLHGTPETAIDFDHNPFDFIKGTKFENRPRDFVGSRNTAETRSIMARIDAEDRDIETLAASGAAGTASLLVAGLLDPLVFAPLGGLRGAKTAAEAMRTTGRVAALSGLYAGASEATLYATQVTRDADHIPMAVATGTILGALIGGGAVAAMSRAERRAVTAGLERDRANLARDLGQVAEMTPTADQDLAAVQVIRDQWRSAGLPDGEFSRYVRVLDGLDIRDPKVIAEHIDWMKDGWRGPLDELEAQVIDRRLERQFGESVPRSGALSEAGRPPPWWRGDKSANDNLDATALRAKVDPLARANAVFETLDDGPFDIDRVLKLFPDAFHARARTEIAAGDPEPALRSLFLEAHPEIKAAVDRHPELGAIGSTEFDWRMSQGTTDTDFLRAEMPEPWRFGFDVGAHELTRTRLAQMLDGLDGAPISERVLQDAFERLGLPPSRAAAAARDAKAGDFGRLAGTPVSAGAAAVEQRTFAAKPLLPEWARRWIPDEWLERARRLNGFSPTQRIFLARDSIETRRAAADLVPVAIETQDAARGLTRTSDGAPDVGSQVQYHTKRFMVPFLNELERQFLEYRYGPGAGDGSRLGRMARAGIEDLRGETGGKATFAEFKAEVSKASWSGDVHEIPQVQAVAQFLRNHVFEPVAERLANPRNGAPKLIDRADIVPKGQTSFSPTSYDKDAIVARRPEFHRIVTDWLESEQTIKAAAKDRLQSLSDQVRTVRRNLGKVEGRLATLDAKEKALEAATRERVVELNAADKRAATVAEAHAAIQEDLSALDEFVGAMRETLRDPDAIVQLDRLEEEVRALRKAERASAVPLSGLAEIDKGEIGATFQGDFQTAAEVFTGRRNMPKPPSFIGYIVNNGGIAEDAGGEVAAALRDLKRPGLIRKDRRALPGVTDGNQVVRSLDDWGEYLHEQFPHAFPERPTVNQVLDTITEAAQGRDPLWFHTGPGGRRHAALDVRDQVEYLTQLFDHLDVPHPGTMKDLAKILNGERGISLEDLEREMAAMDAAGAAIPPGIEAREAEARLAAWHEARNEVRALIEQARRDRAAGERSAGKAAVRTNEAGVAVTRSESRFEVLAARADRQAMVRDILETAQANGRREWERLTSQIEDEVRAWQGDSAADALAALKVRDEAERVRALKMEAGVYEGGGGRLASADDAVNRAVKRIIRSERDLSRQELASRADEIIDRILGSPDGRLPYDVASGGPRVGPPGATAPRGSLHAKDFAIPRVLVEDFTDNDIHDIVNKFLRTVLPDLFLVEKFGDVDMTQAFRRINEEYAGKSMTAATEKERFRIEADRQESIRDLAALRDRVRNTYGWVQSQAWPRLTPWVRFAQRFNGMTMLGSSLWSSIPDMAGAQLYHGIRTVLGDAWLPFLRGLTGTGNTELSAAQKRQAQAMHLALETRMAIRHHEVTDIIDNYRPGSAIEKGMAWASDKFQVLNMQAPWTDLVKTMAGAAAVEDFMSRIERIATGRGTASDIEEMAGRNIDGSMARRIWREYESGGGETFDGVHTVDVDRWRDADVRESFVTAVQQQVDRSVVTPGYERALAMSNPPLALILQFKSFIGAAHERLMIPALQRRDANTLAFMVSSVAAGMLSYKLYGMITGKPVSDRPQDWIKEGISRSGILGWYDDINNSLLSKWTAGRVDMYRAIGADRPASRYLDRTAAAALLGPTWSKIEAMGQVSNDMWRGEWSAADTARMGRMIPGNNLWQTRRLFDAARDSLNETLGLPETRQH